MCFIYRLSNVTYRLLSKVVPVLNSHIREVYEGAEDPAALSTAKWPRYSLNTSLGKPQNILCAE